MPAGLFEEIVAVLQSYLDETGINSGDPICAVAGWVASSRQWSLFEQRWSNASGGVVFHGTEFFARDDNGQRVGPYAGWSDDHAAEYVDGLLRVIEDGWLTAIGTIVDVPAFMALSETERHYLTGRMFHRRKDKWVHSGAPTKPYFLCVSESISDAALCVKKSGLRVDLIFDQQQQYADHARNMFTLQKQHVKFLSTRLGEITFKDKRTVGGLQAADMLAHVCSRRWRLEVGESAELDSVTVRLRPLTHRRIRFVDADGLRQRIEDVPPEVARAMGWAMKR